MRRERDEGASTGINNKKRNTSCITGKIFRGKVEKTWKITWGRSSRKSRRGSNINETQESKSKKKLREDFHINWDIKKRQKELCWQKKPNSEPIILDLLNIEYV